MTISILYMGSDYYKYTPNFKTSAYIDQYIGRVTVIQSC